MRLFPLYVSSQELVCPTDARLDQAPPPSLYPNTSIEALLLRATGEQPFFIPCVQSCHTHESPREKGQSLLVGVSLTRPLQHVARRNYFSHPFPSWPPLYSSRTKVCTASSGHRLNQQFPGEALVCAPASHQI